MSALLKILILEDNATDAEIVQRLLKKENLHCKFNVVMTKTAYLMALDQFQPDVVLSDNSMPQLNAMEALEILRQRSTLIPFIMITGTVPEEFAISIIKQGADDYILKDRMARLPAAIEASLKQRRSDKEIADYKYALDQASIVAITDQKGIIVYTNQNFCNISGYTAAELTGRDLRIINSGYHPGLFIKDLWVTIANGKIWRGEFCNKAKNGNFCWVNTTIVPFLDEKGKPYQYLSMSIDITERKKIEQEILQMNEQLRLLSEHLQKIREDERTHMAREIHDELGQQLTVMKMDLSWLNKKLETADGDVKEKIQTLKNMLDETVEMVRKIASDLRPSLLDDLGLVAAIEWHLNEFEKRSGIAVELNGLKNEILLPDTLKTGLFRILQESLTNVVRHAQAKKITVGLQKQNDQLILTIKDDGIGFDKEKIAAKRTFGILGMKERTFIMGGTYEIASITEKGTTVIVKVPLKK